MERVQQSGTIARPGWSQDTSTDWEGDIPKDQDKVRDRREHCSSWTGLDDLRGRQLPSPFLYVHLQASCWLFHAAYTTLLISPLLERF